MRFRAPSGATIQRSFPDSATAWELRGFSMGNPMGIHLGGGNSKILCFYPYLGKGYPILTNIF